MTFAGADASMIDDILLNKSAIIERCLKRVREEYLGHEDELSTNFTRQDSVVLNLQRACEAAIDLAMHEVRRRRLGLPQDSREAFRMLAEAKLLDDETAKRMCAMVGFRNIAVHQYRELSLDILGAIIRERLDDFEAFTRTLLKADK